MDSKMKPLWLVYNNKLLLGDTLGIIFKNGDGKEDLQTTCLELKERKYGLIHTKQKNPDIPQRTLYLVAMSVGHDPQIW